MLRRCINWTIMIASTAKVFLTVWVMTASLPSMFAVRSPKQCKVTKNQLELKLGKPIKCLEESEGRECFKKNGAIVVQFDSSEDVKMILLSNGCQGMGSLLKIANEIVPKDSRGKLRHPGSINNNCYRNYVEDYECLSMEYTEMNCQDCNPAFIKIVWN